MELALVVLNSLFSPLILNILANYQINVGIWGCVLERIIVATGTYLSLIRWPPRGGACSFGEGP